MPLSDQGLASSSGRYLLVPRVLCFVFAGDEVLLLRGAPDKKIWAGRYNGLGGHVERGEGAWSAAAREIREEAGLQPRDLRLRGVITIDAGESAGIGLYVFSAETAGQPVRPSAEGALEWWPAAALPENIVEDLAVLIPRLRSAQPADPPFSAHYQYDAGSRLVIDFDSD